MTPGQPCSTRFLLYFCRSLKNSVAKIYTDLKYTGKILGQCKVFTKNYLLFFLLPGVIFAREQQFSNLSFEQLREN